MNRCTVFFSSCCFLLQMTFACGVHAQQPTAKRTQQDALAITLGFNGPDVQFPYMDAFYKAQNDYYRSIGKSYPNGARYCHAYVTWDVAEQPVGSGPLKKEGSRSWLEDWLKHAQGHCDRAMLSFKHIQDVTIHDMGHFPTPSEYEAAMAAFFKIDWAYTGWKGAFDFTAWNEPQNGARSGDGLWIEIPARNAADYYLALRKNCTSSTNCAVAAGDFGSNGQLWQTFVQNCADDNTQLCSDASYMDQYKHWIVSDAPTYGFAATFRPEVFAFHGWDDINNYINAGRHCDDAKHCTTVAVLKALKDGGWKNAEIWDTEVAAGQNPQSNPEPVVQACAASYLLQLTANAGGRITRIYWTQPYVVSGRFFSMYEFDGKPKLAFKVMTEHNALYSPPSGASCP